MWQSIATESVEIVRLMERNGKPVVELWHKRKDFNPTCYWEEEGAEVWRNWQKFVRDAEENRRDMVWKPPVPRKMEPH